MHIFEPRYKRMIDECLEQESEFGVVMIQAGALADVGCTARIVEVTKRYDDGRLDILTEGRRRFEVLFQNFDEDLRRAEVAFFEDQEEQNASRLGTLIDAVMTIYSKVVLTVAQPNRALDWVDAKTPHLSFSIAAHLGLSLEISQQLLAMRQETGRLRELHRYLEEIFPKLQRTQSVRQKAGDHGHVL